MKVIQIYSPLFGSKLTDTCGDLRVMRKVTYMWNMDGKKGKVPTTERS
jgi:hypothetical protein